MDIYQYDESFRKKGFHTIAGIDEAGRGCLAGPVVAAAVVLLPGSRIQGLRDSKKVPEKERGVLYREILGCSAGIGVGIVDADAIDEMNIVKATRIAMETAVHDLPHSPDLLLIDALRLSLEGPVQESMIKGESKSASIAAASIIAKVVRDTLMLNFDEQYPHYGFARHKGYCTKEHIERISLHGPCLIHRKSFEPVLSMRLPFYG